MSLVPLALVGGALWWLQNRATPVPARPAASVPEVPDHGSVLQFVPGSTDVAWGPEWANDRANQIRLKEGWSLRSLQAQNF